MPRRPRLNVGDVFRLMTYGDGRHGYGQIVADYGEGHFYFAVFGTEYAREDPALDSIISDRIALLALSLDALLYHRHWTVLDNVAVQEDRLRWPEYKVATAPDVYVVEDAFGRVIRDATEEDTARLPFRKVVAPVVVQHAFEALHGEREWLPRYDHMRR